MKANSVKWISEVLHFCQGLPIILVGCKKDLRFDQKTIEELHKTSQKPVTPEQVRVWLPTSDKPSIKYQSYTFINSCCRIGAAKLMSDHLGRGSQKEDRCKILPRMLRENEWRRSRGVWARNPCGTVVKEAGGWAQTPLPDLVIYNSYTEAAGSFKASRPNHQVNRLQIMFTAVWWLRFISSGMFQGLGTMRSAWLFYQPFIHWGYLELGLLSASSTVIERASIQLIPHGRGPVL